MGLGDDAWDKPSFQRKESADGERDLIADFVEHIHGMEDVAEAIRNNEHRTQAAHLSLRKRKAQLEKELDKVKTELGLPID